MDKKNKVCNYGTLIYVFKVRKMKIHNWGTKFEEFSARSILICDSLLQSEIALN